MPYGLPGAVKIQHAATVQRYDDGRRIDLPAGCIVAPLFPAADQDGFGGGWCCKIAGKQGEVVLVPLDLLRS